MSDISSVFDENEVERENLECDLSSDPTYFLNITGGEDDDSAGEENEGGKERSTRWDTNNGSATKLLICLRKERDGLFDNPKGKKGKIWDKIASKMVAKGYKDMTRPKCSKKWENLKATYKDRKFKQNQTGEKRQRFWPYEKVMDDILGCKATINPPPELLADTINLNRSTGASSSSPGLASNSDYDDEELGSIDEDESPQSSKKRRVYSAPSWLKELKAVQKESGDAQWKQIQDMEYAQIKKYEEVEKQKLESWKEVEERKLELLSKIYEKIK